MSITSMQDENLCRLYDNVREQVEADRGSRYKFMSSPSIKQYATALREEMTRRRLQHSPIEWDRDEGSPACRTGAEGEEHEAQQG
jgi:hypothetical protein